MKIEKKFKKINSEEDLDDVQVGHLQISHFKVPNNPGISLDQNQKIKSEKLCKKGIYCQAPKSGLPPTSDLVRDDATQTLIIFNLLIFKPI